MNFFRHQKSHLHQIEFLVNLKRFFRFLNIATQSKMDNTQKDDLDDINDKPKTSSEKIKETRFKNKKILIEQRNFPLVLSKWIVLGKTNTTLRFKNVKEFANCLMLKDVIFEEVKVCRSKVDSLKDKEANFAELRTKMLKRGEGNKLRNKKGLLLAKNFPQCLAPWANIGDGTVSLILKNIESLEEVLSIMDVIEKELVICLEKESKTLEVSKSNSNN